MPAPEPKVLVTWNDPDGFPRCYAYGPQSRIDAVRAEADRQLDMYLADDRPSRAIPRDQFTRHEQPFHEDDDLIVADEPGDDEAEGIYPPSDVTW